MQSIARHWTVMLEEVTLDMLTEVGGADGAGMVEINDLAVYSVPC